jgi:hypothetical protein
MHERPSEFRSRGESANALFSGRLIQPIELLVGEAKHITVHGPTSILEGLLETIAGYLPDRPLFGLHGC